MKRMITAYMLTCAISLGIASNAAAALLPSAIQNGAPSGIVSAENGGYLLTDVFNKVIWSVAEDGTATRLAGQIGVADVNGEPIGAVADGTLETALFLNPWAMAPFLEGYVVSEPDANIIRYIASNAVQTAAGSGKEGKKDGIGVSVSFSYPTGLAAGENGEVYIADTGNGSIRCLSSDGNVTTVYTGLSEPTGLCWNEGVLYVAETGAHCISKIQDGKRTVVIGKEGEAGYTDGHINAVRLRDPLGVAVGKDGELYVADTGNSAVRCLRGEQMATLVRMDDKSGSVLPRGILLCGDTLCVTDPFARKVLEISLEQPHFTDVASGTWYEVAIYDAVRRGLFNGVGDNKFDPNASTNRAMLAQMLANSQCQVDGDVVIAGDAELTDVSNESWYASVARWAVDLGAIRVDGGVFEPTREITRQEMTLALWRFAETVGADVSKRSDLTEFKDADTVAEEARDAMSWAIAEGLIRGVSADEISPSTTTTRAQMVQVMVRFMDFIQRV